MWPVSERPGSCSKRAWILISWYFLMKPGRKPIWCDSTDELPGANAWWTKTTFIAALRSSGLTAPMVVDGAMNGPLFLAYLRQILVPTLCAGDVVIMDNLSAHKVQGVEEILSTAGAKVLYLPPYSPDLNPIELVFSKVKWLLRSAKERTVDALWKKCGELLDHFPKEQCQSYLRHAGYFATGN